MKSIAIRLSILFCLVLAGCTTAHQMPTGDVDPEGRWRRDKDGFVTSGIAAAELKIDWKGEGDGHIAVTNVPQKEIHDPLESIPEFKMAFADADRQADRNIVRQKGQLGAIHAFWREKKKILRDQYRIDWKSPAELNPMTHFD